MQMDKYSPYQVKREARRIPGSAPWAQAHWALVSFVIQIAKEPFFPSFDFLFSPAIMNYIFQYFQRKLTGTESSRSKIHSRKGNPQRIHVPDLDT